MWGHVVADLAAYAENQLAADRRQRVEQHLTGCAACRRSLEEIRVGIALATELRAHPMPGEVAERIRAELLAHPAPRVATTTTAGGPVWPGSPWSRRWALAATLVVALGAMTALYWQLNRPWVALQTAATVPTAFETDGRRVHDALQAGELAATFRSEDEQALWRWLESQGAPVTSISAARAEAERARFVPVGAAIRTLGGVRASVLSYRIDGKPVTLALAHAAEVTGAPAAGWWTKRVLHRRDAAGVSSLTWTVGGGTYVLVSELDGAGVGACRICHTDPRFSEALRRLSP